MRGFVLFVLQIALVSGCSDTSADCSYYKEAGYCESYGDTLKEMCAKSCGFCSGGGGGDGGEPGTAVDPRPEREPESMELCRDTCSTKDCEWYKTQSHCEKYSAVMVMNCAQTCGWCGATLCTPPDVENGWTDFEMIMIPAGATVNVYCYEGFKNMGYGQLTCGAFGEMEGSARCEEIGGDDSRYPAPEETACQRAAKSAMEPTYVNAQYVIPQVSTHYVPQCDDYEGNYKEIQYDGGKGETFCADMYRGIEIHGTRIQGKHEYISCAPGSAKDYYERLALERGASNSGSDGYNYDTYDNSASSYDYNYDNSDTSYDYNYDNSETSYDYNYDNSGSTSAGGDADSSYDYNYDNSDSGYDYNYDNSDSGYDYNYDNSGSAGEDAGYETSGDDDYYVAGGEDYYVAPDDGYTASDDSYYAGGDGYAAGGDGYAAGGDGYAAGGDGYAAGGDGYAAGGDGYYDAGGDGYAAGGDGYAAGGDGYYVAGGDGYAAGGDGYAAGDDGYAAGGDGYAAGGDGYAAGGDGYYVAGDDGYAAGGDGYAAGGDGYAAGGDGYAAGGDGYYVAGGDGYAAGGDGYAAGGDGYATGGDGYAAGDDGYYAGDDGYYAGDDGYYAGGSDGYASGGDAYYDDGDGFDNSYYYTEGDSEEEVAAVETEVASEPEKVVEEVIMEEEVEENTKDARRRNKKRRRNKREADAEPADEFRRIKPKVVKKIRPRPRPQLDQPQPLPLPQIDYGGLASNVGWLITKKQTLGKIVGEGLCLDKIRPDKCRTYRHKSWCQSQTRYMRYHCPETCEMCSQLNLLTYEENQKIKLRQEGERKRQEAKKREEDKKRAEEKKKGEELLAMLEEEKLLCNIDLEEDECASDIEVKDIVQKAADLEDTTYIEGELSAEVQALWDNYDPDKDIDCSDHQYKQTCDGHKSRGQCQNKPFYMLQNCKKTCEMCSPTICQVPSDIEHGYTDPGMPVPPGFKIFISCEDSYYLLGRGTLTCQKDGYYSPGGECTKMTDNLLYRMTQCQREKYRKSQPIQLPEVGWIIPEYELVPECDTRGQYLPMQCNRCCCFCVNLNGKEIKDTRFTHASGERPDCTPYEYNRRPADKYFPSERSKGKLYGRGSTMEDVFQSYSKTKDNKRSKRQVNEVSKEFLDMDFYSCNDVSPLCKDFARAGQCLSGAPYMVQFCPRSCGTCPNLNIPDKQACWDRRDNCARFVVAGYCSFFKNFMLDNCAKTCEFCGDTTTCADVVVENGASFPTGPVVTGSIVQITCDKGHELDGKAVLRCGESREYNHAPGTCRPVVMSNSTCLNYQSGRPVYNSRFDGYIVPFDAFTPRCNERGEFHEMQCDNGDCWCVDTVTGAAIPKTRGHRTKPRPCNPQPRIFRRRGRSTLTSSEDCTDYELTRCKQNIEIDTDFCLKYPTEAFYNCKRSCKLCSNFQSNEIENSTRWCPVLLVEGGYTEPHHPVLPGNSVMLFCDHHSAPQRTFCQKDGTYHPLLSCSEKGH